MLYCIGNYITLKEGGSKSQNSYREWCLSGSYTILNKVRTTPALHVSSTIAPSPLFYSKQRCLLNGTNLKDFIQVFDLLHVNEKIDSGSVDSVPFYFRPEFCI